MGVRGIDGCGEEDGMLVLLAFVYYYDYLDLINCIFWGYIGELREGKDGVGKLELK